MRHRGKLTLTVGGAAGRWRGRQVAGERDPAVTPPSPPLLLLQPPLKLDRQQLLLLRGLLAGATDCAGARVTAEVVHRGTGCAQVTHHHHHHQPRRLYWKHPHSRRRESGCGTRDGREG